MGEFLILILTGLAVVIAYWQYYSFIMNKALLDKISELEKLSSQRQVELLQLIKSNKNSQGTQKNEQSEHHSIALPKANEAVQPHDTTKENATPSYLNQQITPPLSGRETYQKMASSHLDKPLVNANHLPASQPDEKSDSLHTEQTHLISQEKPCTAPATTVAPKTVAQQVKMNPSEIASEPKEQQVKNTLPRTPEIPKPVNQQKSLASLIWQWLITGNPLAKIGILLLFFGISYLLKFSIENDLISASARLLLAAGGCIVLFAIGWVLKKKNLIYALILQGGSIGGLYITIFAATKIYDFIPALAALGLMTLICLSTVILAVYYRAISLAILASLGGYLAPILLSSGSGNYIGLFSYYLVLSTGILIISHWQVWRLLNLIGFGFTFGIGLIWAISNYSHADYLPCQLFLIANWFIFGFATELSTLKNKLKLNIPFDATLLFGTPLIGFLFQYQLASNWEYGISISSLLYALTYAIASRLVLKNYRDNGKLLSLAFLMLAIAFVTLSVPFAFSAKWTSIAWAVEGIMILIFSVLQQQQKPAIAGTALISVSLLILLSQPLERISEWFMLLIQNIIVIAAAIAWYRSNIFTAFKKGIAITTLVTGVVLWLYSLIRLYEHELQWSIPHIKLVVIAFILMTSYSWLYVGRKLKFPELANSSMIIWPTVSVIVLSYLVDQTLLVDSLISALLWVVVIAYGVYLLRVNTQSKDQIFDKIAIHLVHASFVAIILITELSSFYYHYPTSNSILYAATLLAFSLYMVASYYLSYQCQWVKPYQNLYWKINCVTACVLVIFLLIANMSSGNNMALYFIPLLNPMDIAGLLAIFVLYNFALISKQFVQSEPDLQEYLNYFKYFIPVMLFMWCNGILIRGMSDSFNIEWNGAAILSSKTIQTTLSIIWTVSALVMMVFSTRKSLRNSWFVGGGLLALVIAKLFLIDVSLDSGLHKAIAFIAVSVLILLIGYFSPLPPKREIQQTNKISSEPSS